MKRCSFSRQDGVGSILKRLSERHHHHARVHSTRSTRPPLPLLALRTAWLPSTNPYHQRRRSMRLPFRWTSKPHIFNVFGSNHFKFSLNVPWSPSNIGTVFFFWSSQKITFFVIWRPDCHLIRKRVPCFIAHHWITCFDQPAGREAGPVHRSMERSTDVRNVDLNPTSSDRNFLSSEYFWYKKDRLYVYI